MKKIFVLVFMLSLIISLYSLEDSQPVEEVKAVLDLQKEAWNEGDIEGFMAHYCKSDRLTFQSGKTRLEGWEDLLARYKIRYPEESMGILDYTDLIVHVLADDAACVLGKWILRVKDQTQQGLFTLVFKRTEEGWKIIHDHTS